MNLPQAPSSYDKTYQSEVNRVLEFYDAQNHKRGREVEIGEGRIVLRSPNGTRYQITVDNSGNLSAATI